MRFQENREEILN